MQLPWMIDIGYPIASAYIIVFVLSKVNGYTYLPEVIELKGIKLVHDNGN